MSVMIPVTENGGIEIAASKSYRKAADEQHQDFTGKHDEAGECIEPDYRNWQPCGSLEEAFDIATAMIENGKINRPAAIKAQAAQFAQIDDGEDC